ncbi:transposase [Mesorhizobium sp.]|uniref:transposase n=1 Tax=Mesorhizobium sp. TaxID=1871066 RepID=UPI00338F2987
MSEQAPSAADFLARIAFLEAAVSARDITLAERDEQLRTERAEAALRIQRLQLQIDRFNRNTFGRSSEKLGQMLLQLEDIETDFASSVPDIELPIVADTDKVRVLPVRKLNPNLPRKRVVHPGAGTSQGHCTRQAQLCRARPYYDGQARRRERDERARRICRHAPGRRLQRL